MMSNHYQAVRIMEDKKYQIFISSTYSDLRDARNKISETIFSLRHFPVSMDMLSPSDPDQQKTIHETITSSDYYILIIGHRYGSTNTQGISYTEQEYDHAKKQKIPILAFIRNRDLATTAQERDSNPELAIKLEKFIKKLKSDQIFQYWDTIDDLTKAVAAALPKAFRMVVRTGWIRSSNGDTHRILSEVTKLQGQVKDIASDLSHLHRVNNDSIATTPCLEFKINNSNRLIIKGLDPRNFNNITAPEHLTREQLELSLKRIISVMISEDELASYNASLPSEKEVADYLNAAYLFKAETEFKVPLSFHLTNSENSKATNIRVTLKFPRFVAVRTEAFSRSLVEPTNVIPPTLQTTSTKKYEDITRNIPEKPHTTKKIKQNQIMIPVVPAQRGNSNYQNVHIADNTISLNWRILSGGSHSDLGSNETVIVPIAEGEGYIHTTITCNEYETEYFFEIPISVRFSL